MGLRKEYSCDEALSDLEKIINRLVVHDDVKKEFTNLFLECKKDGEIPMRWINVKLSQYWDEYKSSESLTNKEKEMLEDLMYFWG